MPRRKITEPINSAGALPRLTGKQQRFIEAIASGVDDLEAYRGVYSVNGSKPSTTYVDLARLRRNPKISPWLRYMQALAADRGAYGIVEHIAELTDAGEVARQTGNIGAWVQAIISKGKALGFYVEKHEHTINIPVGELIAQGFRLMGPGFDQSPAYLSLTKRIEPSDKARVSEVAEDSHLADSSQSAAHRSPQRVLAEPNCGAEGGDQVRVDGAHASDTDPPDVDSEGADNRSEPKNS